jgi:hypothetical protein
MNENIHEVEGERIHPPQKLVVQPEGERGQWTVRLVRLTMPHRVAPEIVFQDLPQRGLALDGERGETEGGERGGEGGRGREGERERGRERERGNERQRESVSYTALHTRTTHTHTRQPHTYIHRHTHINVP